MNTTAAITANAQSPRPYRRSSGWDRSDHDTASMVSAAARWELGNYQIPFRMGFVAGV